MAPPPKKKVTVLDAVVRLSENGMFRDDHASNVLYDVIAYAIPVKQTYASMLSECVRSGVLVTEVLNNRIKGIGITEEGTLFLQANRHHIIEPKTAEEILESVEDFILPEPPLEVPSNDSEKTLFMQFYEEIVALHHVSLDYSVKCAEVEELRAELALVKQRNQRLREERESLEQRLSSVQSRPRQTLGAHDIDKDIRDLAKSALQTGWSIQRTGSDHLKWVPPNGNAPYISPSTASDHRNRANLKAALIQRGLSVS